MNKIIHPVAGAVAILTIATFWFSTASSELFASRSVVIAVKTTIPWGLLILVPALIAAGASGFALADGRRVGLIGAKIKGMPFIAGNGILILIPSALYLAFKTKAAEFDGWFYAVQLLELVAGATNITLLGLNFCRSLSVQSHQRQQRRHAETGGHQEYESPHWFDQHTEREWRQRLADAGRGADQPEPVGVILGSEDREGQRAARDRQNAVADAMQQGEDSRSAAAKDANHAGSDRMGNAGHSRRDDRMKTV